MRQKTFSQTLMKYRLYFRTLRLMDANLDRLSEGLRVLEDVARFILGDVHSTEILKRMRHELTTTDPVMRNKLLVSRDSEGDIGREGGGIAGIERRHLVDLVTANARRSQESLRVLEEVAKVPEIPVEIAQRDYQKARFILYEIERELSLKLIRHEKLEKITGLYVIIDSQTLVGRTAIEVAQEVIQGGARVVQLRDKYAEKRNLLAVACDFKQICADSEVLFIMNDHLDIAMACEADGVHLGQKDLPVRVARELLPLDMVIGCSARTTEQAFRAQEEGADYIGTGSIFPSLTKSDAEVIGLERLRKIRETTTLPIVAIGGINEGNVKEVLKTGVESVAVIDAVLNTEDVVSSTRQFAVTVAEGGAN